MATDDITRPISVRMVSAFDKLRATLPDPAALGERMEEIGLEVTPGPMLDQSKRAILGRSEDGKIGVLAVLDAPTGHIAIGLSAPHGSGLRDGELYHMMTRAYGFDGHEDLTPGNGIVKGFAWACVFDGVVQVLRLLSLEDGAWRLEAEVDPRQQGAIEGFEIESLPRGAGAEG